MSVPMKKPICLVENVSGSLQVNKSAIDYLNGINQPVVVVAVVGLYRTGKSYLMNRLAGEHNGFALGSTIESKTKGIWMWCVPHPSNPRHTLVLLDTEGLGDVDKGDSKNDAWIFCLAVLLSSTLVYNSRGTIDNQALENLHYVTELAEQIKVRAPASKTAKTDDDDDEEEDSQFVQFFPNFVWTVRDFILKLEIENRGQVTEDEYLDFALQLKKGSGKKISEYNLPRQCIRNYFPSRKCFVFPMPASQDNMSRLESLDETELWPDFVRVTQCFCDYVFNQSHVKTVKGGHKVNGRMFGNLLNLFVDTITSGKVPCLENAVVAMAQLENKRAVDQGLKLYKSEMEQIKKSFPVSISTLFAEHQKHCNLATTEFHQFSFKDDKGDYYKALMEEINNAYTETMVKNMRASEEKCQKILTDLSKDMEESLKQGLYAKSGGYELYCKDKDKVILMYNKEPNKGDKAEHALEEFMQNKIAESNMIRQTDKHLTEAQKKIEEEKEKVALEMQQRKAEEKRKQKIEGMLKAEKEHQKEQLQQLEQKFNEEKLQQQQELEKAMTVKLYEEQELMKKGFKDQAELLNEEIKNLKKEKENSGGSFLKDYFLPVLDVGKDIISTVFQYKAMKRVIPFLK